MKVVVPSTRCKKVLMPVSADVNKAFTQYLKNLNLFEATSNTPEQLMYSWLVSFAESEEFKNVAEKAAQIKAEEKEKKAKAKAEREAKKAERAKSKEEKQAEKIAKLEAELAKLKNPEPEKK